MRTITSVIEPLQKGSDNEINDNNGWVLNRDKCPSLITESVNERLTVQTTENTEKEQQPEKCSGYKLLRREEAPEYLQFNPFILTGYRGFLNTRLCIESVFWWTNETLNIWSHLFGLALFFCLTVYDFYLLDIEATLEDKFIVAFLLFCFQMCMFLSAVYHTFSCKSEKEYNCLLSFDLFGISLALFSIYMSGVYYAFWCDKELQYFYLITVTVIFVIAMVLQIPRLEISSNVKMIVFVCWAAYGVIPSIHWIGRRGGFNNPLVMLLLPRVVGMYCISGLAFALYLTRIPERFYPGCVDYIGHSHQWWHFFVVCALYYWHNTGMIYVDYRINHACPNNLKIH